MVLWTVAQRQYTSSLNRHVLSASVALCGLLSSIDTPTSSLSINSSSPNIIPTQGTSKPASLVNVLNKRLRWHDHDPMEIQYHADRCIEEAIKHLESAGWSKDSIKIIGILVFISCNTHSYTILLLTQESPTREKLRLLGVGRLASHFATPSSGRIRARSTRSLNSSKSSRRLVSK